MSSTPLRSVKNFGPVTVVEFEAMGIHHLEQIETMGFEEICRMWVQYYPERLNANAFIGIICALDGAVWTKATPAHRRAAHEMVALLRRESGLAPAKPARSRK